MEGISLPSYDGVESTISVFIGCKLDDLKHWHITDVPGINDRIATFLESEYKITTGYDLFRWFGSKGYNAELLRIR
jgi:hypothetical protein